MAGRQKCKMASRKTLPLNHLGGFPAGGCRERRFFQFPSPFSELTPPVWNPFFLPQKTQSSASEIRLINASAGGILTRNGILPLTIIYPLIFKNRMMFQFFYKSSLERVWLTLSMIRIYSGMEIRPSRLAAIFLEGAASP